MSLTHSFSLLFFSTASSLTHFLIFRFVSSSLLCLSQSKAWVLLSLSLSHLSWAVVTVNVKFGLILGFAWSVVWSVLIAVVGLINIGCWLSLAWVNQKQVWYFFFLSFFLFLFNSCNEWCWVTNLVVAVMVMFFFSYWDWSVRERKWDREEERERETKLQIWEFRLRERK